MKYIFFGKTLDFCKSYIYNLDMAKKGEEAEKQNEPGAESKPPAAPPPAKDEVQILIKVHPSVKEKAQKQAELAFQYGWIESPTLKSLYIWTTMAYLDAGIKAHIQTRKERLAQEVNAEGTEAPPSKEGTDDGG